APIITAAPDIPPAFDERTNLTLTWDVFDADAVADGDRVSGSLALAPTGMTALPATDLGGGNFRVGLTWTPADTQDGTSAFYFNRADLEGASIAVPIPLVVRDVNRNPVIDSPQTVPDVGDLQFQVVAHDDDVVAGVPDRVHFGLSATAPAGATMDASGN